MARALFLDVDGVVNSDRSVWLKLGPKEGDAPFERLNDMVGPLPYGVKYGLLTVDSVCVELINRLFDMDPDMWLVLSSSHRTYLSHNDFGSASHLSRLRLYLDTMGFRTPRNFSITPKLYLERGAEVDKWLELNAELNIEHYAAVDDSPDFFRWQPVVYTDPHVAITFENFCELTKLLNLQVPSQIII